jgi:hypothetical protein
MTRRRGADGGKEPFCVLRVNWPKKRQKNVQSRRLTGNKKVEEVRDQKRFRGVEGQLGNLLHL